MVHRFAKPHPDSEFFDEVRITTVPRWKESEMSGDEWRRSACLQLLWKGNVLVERSFRNIETAVAILPSLIILTPENGEAGHPEDSKDYCFQPGCSKRAQVEYELVREYSREGFSCEPTFTKYRRFCNVHSRRGDCGLEDSDRNYVQVLTEATNEPD